MKNCEEWSLAFDQLYNNITSNQAPGINEYEKSKFLTSAQRSIVIGLYNGTIKESFEETEELTDYLYTLISQRDCSEVTSDVPHVVSTSQVFLLPEDLMFRTLEICLVDTSECGQKQAVVIPVTQDEYWRVSRNPFKGISKNDSKVIRLTLGNEDAKYSELVSSSHIAKYTVRYLKKPEPIILTDLSQDGLSIEGCTSANTCKLSEQIHDAILAEAVRQAKAVWAA